MDPHDDPPVSPLRSRIMTSIRSKDSKAEMALRRAVHGLGLRYALHSKALPGKPDLCFPSARVAVFVDSDFWHARSLVEGGRLPEFRVRKDFWEKKLVRNARRDREVEGLLRETGWLSLRFWESDVLRDPGKPARIIQRAVRRRRR